MEIHKNLLSIGYHDTAHSAAAAAYIDFTFTEEYDTLQWVFCYDTKQSDGEVAEILKIWGMLSTPSLPALPGPLWSRMVAPKSYLWVK